MLPNEAAQAIGRLLAGESQRQVARAHNVSQSVIQRLWARYQETGSAVRRPGSGRLRATSARNDRAMVVMAKRRRFDSAVTLNRDFSRVTNVNVSVQTFRNRLHEANLHARRPAVRVPLTAGHRQNRLAFARDHHLWRLRQYRHILFTDESKFCLDFNDGRRRVWRQRNDRFRDCCVAEHDRWGSGSVTVWGGISYDGRTDLHVFMEGTVTSQRYRDEILSPYVVPYAGAVGQDFILMDDNATAHRARIVNAFLGDQGIERMDWPARSPDLNPIEHVWDMLQRRIQARIQKPTTRIELANALVQEWELIPLADIHMLIRSFPTRLQEVIRSRGGHTHY